ncbi:peptide ABC transporter substrate-binding protein [Mycobacterium sp. 1482292.6]|uniref:ABC transporter substrate-binding protein n=1 Tax=Mycobacterium sp. 1482292.6 TaxID=1834081 RepID=UPI0008003C3A|nr:ABC transporter substrate-binding protein [Mycobacterium sp. 1482292.6]OBJ10065.1 peptide ABC transporter substrate-binding protein [Mycobacterium sp. 1482292.6]
MSKAATRAVVLGAVLSVVAAGCSSHRHAPSAGPTGAPVHGGTLTYSDVQFVTDTMAANYSANNLMFQVLDRVVYVDPKTDAVHGWLAKTFSRNQNATRYTFTIRNGVTFSDRTPLTAEVVKANFDQLGKGDPGKKMPAFADFVGYDRSEVSGNVVTVFLNRPNTNFYKVLSYSRAGIRAPSTLALDYQRQAKIENVVGSGPFVYQSQIPDQQVVLKKRPDYAWAPSSWSNPGAAYLDKVVFRVIAEPGLRAGAVQSHQVDVARGIQPTDEPALKQGGLQVISVAAPAETANLVGFRINNQVVNDVRVRRALQLGIDRQAVVDTVLSDSYRASDSVLGHDDPLFANVSADIGYRPQQAANLLDAAGWRIGGDGVREKDGKKLNLTLAASNQSVVFRPAFEFIESQWRELGVVLQNRAGDTTFFNASSSQQSTPLFGTRIQYNIGLGLLFGRAKSNLTFAKNDDLLALSEEELKETDPARLKAIVAREQRKIIDDQLALVLWDEVQVHAAAPNVHVEFTRYTEPLLQSAWKA